MRFACRFETSDGYNPVVSVILPTYNREDTILRAVKSVLNQTYSNIELIIVDDGSTDRTREKLAFIAEDRMKYIRLREQKGVAEARNVGIMYSVGEFIAFQDSDDEWYPNKLERQMEVMCESNDDVGLVHSGFHIYKDGKHIFTYKPKERGHILSKHLMYNKTSGCSTWLLRRAAVFDKEIGLFNNELRAGSDYEYTMRLLRKYKVDYVKEPLVVGYRDCENRVSGPGSRNKNLHGTMLGPYQLRILEGEDFNFITTRRVKSFIYYSMAQSSRDLTDNDKAWVYMKMSLCSNPFNLRNILLLLFLLRDRFQKSGING